MWDKKYGWNFGPRGCGMKWGPNDVGIGTFKKNPYVGLAKEILQNSSDAKDTNYPEEPVRVVFEMLEIKKDDIPGAGRLSEIIKACGEYYNEGENGEKTRVIRDAAIEYLDNSDKIPVMKISDYNTTGLLGSGEKLGSNWTGLVRESGACNGKGSGYGGAFGVGKYAPFNFSAIRTIIYSTYDVENVFAFQGKILCTTFKDPKDGQEKQNIGFFGNNDSEDCDPIYCQQDIPEVFKRNEYGTDLFVLGCNADSDWMQQITISVLKYFFYPIYKNELVVSVKDSNVQIDIDKNSISDLMDEYKDYAHKNEISFNAPLYLDILQSDNSIVKRTDLRNKGTVELYFKVDPEYTDKGVAEMRKPGMVITEDTGFNKLYFYGVLIATGENAKSNKPEDNIDSFLRQCENQSHDTWSKDEYGGTEKDRKEAEKVIKEIHNWIRKVVKEEIPEPETKQIDAFGLADLLPNMYSEGMGDSKEPVYKNYTPMPIQLIRIKSKKKVNVNKDIGSKKKRAKKGKGPINIPDPDPNPKRHKSHTGADEQDKSHSKKKRALRYTPVARIKTPYDVSKKQYNLYFTPERNEKYGYVSLQIGLDDDDMIEANIKAAIREGKNLKIEDGLIVVPGWRKGERIKLEITGVEPCQLEVLTYAEE